MSALPHPWSQYPTPEALDRAWHALTTVAGGCASVAGTSVEGRPIHAFDLGNPAGSPVLLSGLMHGVEMVGALALLDFVRGVIEGPRGDLLRDARLVVIPVVNPDAYHENCTRLLLGRSAFQRCNARGVDLNRNFPWLRQRMPWNPLGGSRFHLSPHYVGPAPLSEPESRALHAVADALRPRVSLAFHSFGELLLYPWAYTSRPNPKRDVYQRAGRAFVKGLQGPQYRVMQATDWYATVGDMDDWLDAAYGTLAFTVEVSRPMRRLANARRWSNPFAWSNPVDVDGAVHGVGAGADALVRESLAA
jgi:predicted deacylase